MNGFGPIICRQFLDFLSPVFQVLNQIQKQIHRAILSRRPMLVNNGVNGHGGMNARQFVPNLIAFKGLHDRDSAVLTIVGLTAPPNYAEDLAGTKVVYASTLSFLMMDRRRPEAEPIESGAGNIASDETSQAN